MSVAGATMFARFAYPPNLLGYCGPHESEALGAYGRGDALPDPGLEQLARGFEGAWPYLELLAGAAGTDDALDARVVEAYWIGNSVLHRVGTSDWGWHLTDRFGPRCGADLAAITDTVGHGSVANHAFHVFGIYPWVGLLREGRGGAEPLRVIDRCRIRWGTVREVEPGQALVDSRPLVWDGRLSPGPTTTEAVRADLVDPLEPGDIVALHWDWICQRLDGRQSRWLRRVTAQQLAVANRRPAPVA